MSAFLAFGLALLAQIFAMLLVTALEYFRPAKNPRAPGRLHNVGIGAVLLAAGMLAGAWLGPVTTLAVNAMGGGFFVLPTYGLGLVAGIAIYVLAMDLGEYVFHRAQHAIPFMWAMHSLHHSDPDFGTTTTIRHFWLEPAIKGLTVWLAVGLLFKASPLIVSVYGVVSYYNFLIHANLRLNFGKASWLLNAPAYHRLHHSCAPEHFNCNFAALFPVFDVLSGAYRPARDGECPDTGLDTGAKPDALHQALFWPLRNFTVRRWWTLRAAQK